MKIDGNQHLTDLEMLKVRENEQKRDHSSSKTGQQGQSGNDRLEISTAARQLEHYQQVVQEAPDIRSERVDAIKEKLDTQTYNVTAEEIADALITGSLLDKQA